MSKNQREEFFLNQIELSTDVSLLTKFKKKIIAIFEPETAYKILVNIKIQKYKNNKIKIVFPQTLLLTHTQQCKLEEAIIVIYGLPNKIHNINLSQFNFATSNFDFQKKIMKILNTITKIFRMP